MTRRAASVLLSLSLLTACGRSTSTNGPADVLLFNGHGTSPGDVDALEHIMRQHQFSYATADSSRLNAMSESELKAYRLLIVPGGNFVDIGYGLTPSTATRLRRAIQGGLNYFGVCGGAFLAGNSPYNGLNLTSGVRFKFYAAEERGIRKAPVAITAAGAPTREQYWEDGPQLAGWGDVVAKYPDGTPAIVEGSVGDGWVILTGVHPEAQASWWSGMTSRTPVSENNRYAATLMEAALKRIRLPHF